MSGVVWSDFKSWTVFCWFIGFNNRERMVNFSVLLTHCVGKISNLFQLPSGKSSTNKSIAVKELLKSRSYPMFFTISVQSFIPTINAHDMVDVSNKAVILNQRILMDVCLYCYKYEKSWYWYFATKTKQCGKQTCLQSIVLLNITTNTSIKKF